MAVLAAWCLGGCGGGSSITTANTTSTNPIATSAANVQPVIVDAGPSQLGNAPAVDTLYTSVTICVPGSTTDCQTIDHIQVDTGSSGLRILGSVLTLTLPQRIDSNNNAFAECTQFIDGYSWGPLKTADIQISGESAAGLAVQVIGDNAYPVAPNECQRHAGTAENTVETFGANGILGVGPFIQDCGSSCASSADTDLYYSCPSTVTCATVAMPIAQQVSNPVAFFATDNNGVIIELPSVVATGAATVSGSLVFGIDTQSNNGLGTSMVFTIDPDMGFLTTQYKGSSLIDSFIDSGSNAFYFPDSSISVCGSNTSASGFFCPTATLSLSATIEGLNSASSAVSFNIANANNLLAPAIAAAGNLGAPNSDTTSFDWGLPFFFGRNVYTAIEQHNTSGGAGPYFAF
jgi:hypothetical protein